MNGRENQSLFGILRPYWQYIILIVAIDILGAVAQIGTIQLFGPILDEGVYAKDVDKVLELGFHLLLLTAELAIVLAATAYIASLVATSVSKNLRMRIMESTLALKDLHSAEGSSVDPLTSLTEDVSSVQRYVFETLSSYIAMPILLAVLLYNAYYTSPVISCIMVAVMAVILTVSYVISLRVRPLFDSNIKAMNRVNGALKEKITGARTVRGYSGYEYETEKFEGISNEFGKSNKRIKLNSFYIPYLATAMMWVFIVFIFIVSTIDDDDPNFNVIEVIIFMQYATYIVSTLALIPYLCVGIPRARVCFNRINRLANRDWAVGDEAVPYRMGEDEVVRVEDVRIVDAYGMKAVDGISFNLRKGEVVSLVGPNDCGSSALIMAMMGFKGFDSGRIVVGGYDASSYDSSRIHDTVAYASNSINLFSNTLRFNIDPHRRHTDEDIMEVCAELGLDRYIRGLPEGLDTVISEEKVVMSGGQRLQIIIARCILREAQLYVFDECFFSIDMETRHRIMETIRKRCAQKAVLFIGHDASTCEMSDRTILMDNGVISDSGSHEELLSRSELYNRLYSVGKGRYGVWA